MQGTRACDAIVTCLKASMPRFGEDVMETMLHFTTDQIRAGLGDVAQAQVSILDIGTGNGVLPLELASLGHSTVTGARHETDTVFLQLGPYA